MISIITRTLITFFAIYGFTALIKEILDMFFMPKKNLKDLLIVIKVLNSEDTLEGIVRMILWKCLSLTHGGFMPNILIVDMGSSDDTADIAKRLSHDYSFIRYTTHEEYLNSQKKD